MRLGESLKRIREKRDVPLRKIAAELDLDQSTLSKIERGERLPKENMLPKIADFYKLKLEELKEDYISEKVLMCIKGKKDPERILELAKQKIQYLRNKNSKQAKLEL